jgi:uncharacterized protein YcbX
LSNALDEIENYAPLYASAKKNRVQLEEFKKSKRSQLYLDASGSTVAEREHWAYAHKEYQEVIDGLAIATETETDILWKLKLAEMKVEVWRTLQANKRREAKIL